MAFPFAKPEAAFNLQIASGDPSELPPVGAPLTGPPPPASALDAVSALELGNPATWTAPPLAVSHVPTPLAAPEPLDPYAATRASLEQPRGAGGTPKTPVNTPTIGAARIGDRYEPKSWGQIMTSDTPIQDLLEHVLGPKRPDSVYSADPMGIQASLIGAGPPPMFGGPIEPVGEEVTRAAARGLYSKIDRFIGTLPERALHPSKWKSLLRSNASQEEIAFRKIEPFLTGKGNTLVTPAELAAHLAEHPAPMPVVKTLGGMSSEEVLRQHGFEMRGVDYDAELWPIGGRRRRPLTQDQIDALPEVVRAAAEDVAMGTGTFEGTKYSQYQLPGGENYRENLFTLPPEPTGPSGRPIDRLSREEMNRWYREHVGHDLDEDEPGMTVAQMRQDLMEYLEAAHAEGDMVGQDLVLGSDLPPGWSIQPLTGNPQRRFTLVGEDGTGYALDGDTLAEATGHALAYLRRYDLMGDAGHVSKHFSSWRNLIGWSRSNERELPGLGRGHFSEEYQSDLHQQGAKEGYRTAPTPEQTAALKAARAEASAADAALSDFNQRVADHDRKRQATIERAVRDTMATGGFPHVTTLKQAMDDGPAATALWRKTRDHVLGTNPEVIALTEEQFQLNRMHDMVVDRRRDAANALQGLLAQKQLPPDLPFKETWIDLALKQGLLDAAHDPNAHWYGFTSGETQAARYDLSKHLKELAFEPEEAGDFSLGTLVGKNHKGEVVVQQDNITPADFAEHIGAGPAKLLREKIREVEAQGEAAFPHAEVELDARNEWRVRQGNGRLVGAKFATEYEAQQHADMLTRASWDAYVPRLEGQDLIVGDEGMRFNYDQLTPARLNKLLKKYGVQVERRSMRVPYNEDLHRNTARLGYAFFDTATPTAFPDGKRIAVGRNQTLYTREELGEAFRKGLLSPDDFAPSLLRKVEQHGIDEQIWVVPLSDQVKAQIRGEGFPLMAATPIGAGLAALAADRSDERRAGPPLAVSHVQTPPPAPSGNPAVLAAVAQRFPRFAAALASHPPAAAQTPVAPPLEALRKATSIGADPRRAEARAVMEPAYRPAAQPRPPVIRAPSTSEWLTDLEQRFYRMVSQTLPGQASDATGLLTDFAGKAEELAAGPPVVTTSIVPPPGGDSAKKVAQAIEAGLAKQEAGGAVRKAVEIVNDKAAAHFAVAPGERVNDRLIVSTRVPTSKPTPPLAPSLDPLMTGVEDIARDPDLMKKIADRLRKDPLLTDAERKLNDRGVLDAFVEKGAQNTLGLIKMQPGEQVTQSRRWYQGAHDMGNRFGAAVGVSGEQGAAALAAESPSKEWNQNVEISRRIMEWWKELRSKDTVFDQAIFDQHASNAIKSTEQWIIDKKLTGAKADAYRALKAAKLEKTRLQIDKPWSALPERVKAQMVRAMDELHNAQTYPVYGPDGTIAHTLALKADKKTPKKLTWQSFDNVANALSMLEDGSAHNISKRVGKGHKVRSFFNNINVPTDPRSATADTHNVGGVHLRPMGGSAPEVKFVMAGPGSAETGIKGAHGLYRDATIMASHARPDLGLLPNQTQSVAWESIKGLFSPAQRRDPAFRQRIVDFYSAFQRGNISMEQLHERIYDAAGGLDKPEWGAR